jgi:hypothetical protein
MQTDGVDPNYHNRRGTVMTDQRTPANMVRVALDEDDDYEEINVERPASCLMRIPRRLNP